MDFHILTKKQAECLTQIATRETVSSFFEPLRIVRELESLTLISMEPSDQFDSGFCYSLTGAGKALAPFRAGTKYSIVPLSSDHKAIFVHYNPAIDGDFDPEEAAKERAALEQSNKNLAEAVQRLESDLQVAKNEIVRMDKVRTSLQWQRDDALNEREKSQQDAKILSDANHRQYQALHEKDAVIARLQNTVNDYVEANRTQARVIRDQADKLRSLQIHADSLEQRNKVDQEAIRQLRNLTAPTGSVWVNTFADKRLTEGTYVFRNSQGEKPTYAVGTVRPVSDHCMRCRDRLDQPINLNQFTEAMRLDQ